MTAVEQQTRRARSLVSARKALNAVVPVQKVLEPTSGPSVRNQESTGLSLPTSGSRLGPLSVFVTLRAILVASLLLLGVKDSVLASTELFYYYNRLCVSVIDLRDDHKYTFRDDLGSALISQLRQFATQASFRIAIESRQQCQKPDDPGYARQMRLDLSIKRQIAELDGAKKHIVVIDGSSPNAQGALSAYELMPIVIIQDSPIEEREILKILAEFTHKKVLTRRDSSTK
jgi:hypothetical protein